MENTDIARILAETADLLELTGDNPFKVRAYRQAAQGLALLPGPVAEAWAKGELQSLPGIGEKIAGHVGELLETGEFREHDRLAARVPVGVLEILRLEGVGPKTAEAVWKRLHVLDVDALESACRDGRVAALPRLGARRAAAILAAIERQRRRGARFPLHEALGHAGSIVARMRKVPGVRRAEAAGSLRRRRETVGDVDVLVASDRPAAATRAFIDMPGVSEVIAEGPTRCSVRLEGGLQVDLRVVEPDTFGAALHYFTGSKSHNIALRTRAVHMGIKLSEYGVFDREGKRLAGAREEDVFRAVGLPWIPPELREGAGEIEAAEERRLPDLVNEDDVQADLHVHTDASSDGHSTLEEIAAAAHRLGRSHVAITDHSRSRPLGLDATALRAHAARVRALDRELGGRPRLLAGVEVDILPDGSLDLPADVLAELDWVVASIHAHLQDPPEVATRRLLRAIESGSVDAIGHPTGRIIGARDPYGLDLEKVLRAARAQGVAMEINAMPERLDLNDTACRMAKAAGVKLAIGSDAHHATQLANLRYGVWIARRGWLTAGDLVDVDLRRRRAGRRGHGEAARGAGH